METHLISPKAASYWTAVAAVSLLKLLLLNSYRSTDFEVHRNWLAITHSLPLSRWYYEDTSEWTLDYPPFFAYFEWMLSQAAVYFDSEMLQVKNLNYASFHTILFQKLSVIVVDFILAYAVLRCSRASSVLYKSEKKSDPQFSNQHTLEKLFVLVFLNAGLFMVDHIHFQYNGFLFGILLLSIAACLEDRLYLCTFLFASLLNFKHIFVYVAPAYGIYLLRRKVFPPNAALNVPSVLRSLFTFALIALSVLALSFGPFFPDHIPQILKRLFPFQRGLSHAYWAPNFWALYNTLDWALNRILKVGGGSSSSVTSGLVGEAAMSVLPQVLPLHTFLITLAFMLPAMYSIWRNPTPKSFVQGVVATGWTSFMFGYHVHEKAILNVLIPYALIASIDDPATYFITLVSGTVSLFPLLFTPTEIVLKGILTVLHLSLSLVVLPKHLNLNLGEKLYLLGFAVVYLIENLGNTLIPTLPFLPLMIVSDYCFLGMIYSYAKFYWKLVVSGDLSAGKSSTPKSKFTSTTTSTPAAGSSPKKSENQSGRGSTSSSKKKSSSNNAKTPPSSPVTRRVLRDRTKLKAQS